MFIFYAKNNTYYGSPKKRDGLKQFAQCQLEFQAVDPGKNATDFAIAIAASKRCCEDRAKCEENIYLLVSQDKHFDLIQNSLALAYNIKGMIKRVDNLEEGFSRYFLFKAESKQGLMIILERQFGKKLGQMLCGRIEKIFADCKAEERGDKVNLKKRIVSICSICSICKGVWHGKHRRINRGFSGYQQVVQRRTDAG